MSKTETRTVTARMINEALYCKRLCYLEWTQGEFEQNFYTIDGTLLHERVDKPTGEISTPDSDVPYRARSLWLSSDRLGITAKIDLVEGEDGIATPVEYKRGTVPDVEEKAYLPERAQVCTQAMLLREHGYRVDKGEIYFAGSRKRVEVELTEELISQVLTTIEDVREICAGTSMPAPLVDSPKCAGCSLVGICLPDETNLLKEKELTQKIRLLHSQIDTRATLHVQEQGARIGLSGDCLHIRAKSGESTSRLAHTASVSVYGAVQISTQAIREMLQRNIPISFFTTGGWYCGRTQSVDSKNIEVRMAQFKKFSSDDTCLLLARRVIESKIKNCRTLLRRNGEPANPATLSALDRAAHSTNDVDSLDSLLGIEGAAARAYFSAFSTMLRPPKEEISFAFEGRNRRPPKDPVNALLSLSYALLTKDCVLAASIAALDPYLGFYHQPRFGRPALGLDIMEEFRPILADSVVISVINTGEIATDDFITRLDAVALKPTARRRFIQAYERRLDQLVTHPVFGYRISYRRVLEVQARLLSRFLLGEIAEYTQFGTR